MCALCVQGQRSAASACGRPQACLLGTTRSACWGASQPAGRRAQPFLMLPTTQTRLPRCSNFLDRGAPSAAKVGKCYCAANANSQRIPSKLLYVGTACAAQEQDRKALLACAHPHIVVYIQGCLPCFIVDECVPCSSRSSSLWNGKHAYGQMRAAGCSC